MSWFRLEAAEKTSSGEHSVRKMRRIHTISQIIAKDHKFKVFVGKYAMESSLWYTIFDLTTKKNNTGQPWRSFHAVWQIRIQDQVLFYPWIRDLGWKKNLDPDLGSESRMKIPNHFSESLETVFFGGFLIQYLNSLMWIQIRDTDFFYPSISRIRDPGWKKFGSEIREKHPDLQHCFLVCLRKRIGLKSSLSCLSGGEGTLKSSDGFFTITELRACNNNKK